MRSREDSNLQPSGSLRRALCHWSYESFTAAYFNSGYHDSNFFSVFFGAGAHPMAMSCPAWSPSHSMMARWRTPLALSCAQSFLSPASSGQVSATA